MSVPRPIVRCENEETRNRLRMRLYAMGFCAKCLGPKAVLTEWGNQLYVQIDGNCQGARREIESNMDKAYWTIVNSPSHMISYIKRHNLAPQTAAPTDD